MAENNIDINIRTKADTTEVKDLKTALEELKDSEIEIKTNIDASDVDNINNEINNIDGENIDINTNINDEEVKNVDNEVKSLDNKNINIKTDVDDSDINSTENKLSNLDNETINLNVDADDSDLKNIDTEIEDIDGTSLSIGFDIDSEGNIESTKAELESIDGETLSIDLDLDSSQIDDATDRVQSLNDALDDAISAVDNFASTLNSIDPSVLDNLSESARQVSNNFKDATDSSMSLVDAMAAGQISGGMADTLMSSVNAAGNYSDTMVRLGYAMSGTSMSAEQAQASFGSLISTMTSETGRGAGTVRNHLINMGNVGITSSQVLQDSFRGISKASFQMGTDFDTADRRFQQMVLSGRAGALQLRAFGLNTQDLANAMGVSVDEVSDAFKNLDANSRAAVLSTALNMKYGEDVTENYKNSYEHLIETVGRAKDFLIRSLGEAILPSVIPAMEGIANGINAVTNAFRALPAPVQGVIGGFGAFLIGISSVSIALSALVRIIMFTLSPFAKLYNYFFKIPDGQQLTKFRQHLKSVGDMANTVKTKIVTLASEIKALGAKALTAARELASSLWSSLKNVASAAKTAAVELLNAGKNALIAGANAIRAAAMWVAEKAAKIASSIASGIAAAAQWALNVAMSANPIMLVVIAIIALIAILGYLYFHNETVRNAINGLGQALVGVWNWIVSSVSGAVQSIISFAQGLYDSLMGIWTWLTEGVNNTSNSITSIITGAFTWIQDAFNAVITFFQTYGQLFVEIFFVMATGGIGAIVLLIGQMNGMPSTIGGILQSALNYVINFASNFINKLANAGTNAVNRFKSGISRLSSALSDELNEMISEATNFVGRIGSILWNAGVNAVQNFLNGLGRHSPGIIQTEMLAELKETATRIPESASLMKSNIVNLAKTVVEGWGNPQFAYGFSGGGFKLNNDSINDNSDLIMLLNTIIGLLKNNNGGNYVFNHYGDLDDEEKMERILEFIRRELSWNNKTAGRSV